MTDLEKEQLFLDTLALWGERSQLEMLQEEATELALAARKHIRKNDAGTHFDLASEIADVEIMIEQMKQMIPGLVTLINGEKGLKLTRLRKRVDEKRFENAKS